jgi:hypothetical protein
VTLLDRYLASVRSALPESQRDDIFSELSEDLRSQIEDREAELGRPLTDSEVETMLKRHGHPLIVAGRFREDHRNVSFGRELIGPTLYPFYIRVLMFNLGITSVIQLVVFTALFFSGQVDHASGVIPSLFYGVLCQFVVVTLIFSIADRHWKKHPDSWDPRKLTHILHPAFAIQGEPKPVSRSESARVSRFDSVAQLVALCVGLVWLRIAQGAPFLIFGPAAAFLRPAPIWHHFYWPVVALAGLGIVQALINLVRPDWLRVMVIYRALTATAWIVMLFFLLKAGNWVALAQNGPRSEDFRRTADIFNHIGVYLVAGFAAVAIYNLVRHLRRLLRLSRSNGESLQKGHNHA